MHIPGSWAHTWTQFQLPQMLYISTSTLVQTLKKPSLLNFAANFLLFYIFSYLAHKMLRIKILTSIWSAQHSNTDQNIQHPNDV